MRVTVEIEDRLHARAKREAARRGITLGQLVEKGLRWRLAQRTKRESPPKTRGAAGPLT